MCLHPSKQQAFSYSTGSTEWASDVEFCSRGILVVGVPVGTADFEIEYVQSVVARKARSLSRLESIEELQARLHLLRFLSRPALNHLLRTVPTQGLAFMIKMFCEQPKSCWH